MLMCIGNYAGSKSTAAPTQKQDSPATSAGTVGVCVHSLDMF